MSRTSLYQRFGKRLFDLLVTVPLLILISPLMLLIGLCSLLFLGRPVLFKQGRIGYREKPFILYKFRSMREIRDRFGRPLPDEARLPPYGRLLRVTSLDEFPTFWNVLKGDMSLVGPRPLLPEYLPRYDVLQRRRHEVKPGITGWAQVNGRNALTWEQKFELDVWYVDNWSLWLDTKILWMTVLQVLRREGISQAGHATMPEFMGTASSSLETRGAQQG
jgi:lipopolysaccharide/colanic/teichoic acid biosynthesis glycosyltransferase